MKQTLPILLLLALVIGGCSSSKPVSNANGANLIEVRFNEGKKAFEKEEWLEATTIFDEIRLQAPSSEYAAEAAFLEGMARYKSGTFISAAVDFRSVRRNFPSSEFAPKAQFMIAESYYALSPRAELDQTYTQYSINEYQTFLRDYSNGTRTLLDSADHRISELRNKQAMKIFLSAELYIKLLDNKSGLKYFARVVDSYYDTPSAIESQLRIAEVQYERKRTKEVREALATFDEKFLITATQAQRERSLKLRQQLSLQ